MIETGRVCIKTAGNETGKYCVILEQIDDTFVMIGGEVKKARCNIKHLELLPLTANVKKSDSNETIIDALVGLNIIKKTHTRKKEKKEKTPKPIKKRAISKIKKSPKKSKKKADKTKKE